MSLPLPGGWTTGEAFTATAENNVEAAVNALGAGTLPIPKKISTAATSETLTTGSNVYVYTGTSVATWTLPAVAGNSGAPLLLINRSSYAVHVKTAGSDSIDNSGALSSSFSLAPGGVIDLVNTGTYWWVVSQRQPSVTYDNSAQSAYQSALASGTAFTWTHSAATSLNTYAIVAVYFNSSSAMSMGLASASVSFGSSTLSSLGPSTGNNAVGNQWVWVFGGPVSAGASQTVSVTLTETGKTFYGYAASFTYLNVSLPGVLQTSNGSSTTPALSVPCANGDTVWASIEPLSTQTTSGFNLAARQSVQSGSNSPYFVGGDLQASAATLVSAPSAAVSGTLSAAAAWAMAGLDLSPNVSLMGSVAHDATGGGATGTGATLSWSHTSTAGAYVLVFIDNFRATVTGVTYGGTAMTQIANVTFDETTLCYGLANVAGGAQTVTVTNTAPGEPTLACSVSYTNVASVTLLPVITNATTTTLGAQQAVPCLPGQMVAQAFGSNAVTTTTVTGGTNRYNAVSNGTLTISDTTAPANFTASNGASVNFIGLAVVLSPPTT